LQNAYGSELLGLPIPLAIQFWNNGWRQNTLDSCTTIAADQFAWTFPAGTVARPNGLLQCESIATVTGTAPNYTVRLSAPGAANAGWAVLTLNLGATAAGNTCTTVNAGTGFTGPATTANTPWLQHNWTGAVGNPVSRATFGAFRSPLIYRRENY
jgi:MSHA biogenesis protein MshQ